MGVYSTPVIHQPLSAMGVVDVENFDRGHPAIMISFSFAIVSYRLGTVPEIIFMVTFQTESFIASDFCGSMTINSCCQRRVTHLLHQPRPPGQIASVPV